jgi:hypothetical protein
MHMVHCSLSLYQPEPNHWRTTNSSNSRNPSFVWPFSIYTWTGKGRWLTSHVCLVSKKQSRRSSFFLFFWPLKKDKASHFRWGVSQQLKLEETTYHLLSCLFYLVWPRIFIVCSSQLECRRPNRAPIGRWRGRKEEGVSLKTKAPA